MSAFTLSTSVLRPRASVGLSSRRRRTRSAVRAAGRESSDSFEAFDTSEIEALLASTTEAREEIEGGLEDECGYLADFSADLRLQVEELAAIIELTQGYSVEDLLLEDGDELKDDLNAELVEAQNNIVVLRESVQHLYHVVETTLVRETRSSPRESRPVTTTRVSNDDPDRAARSTRDPRLTVRHAPPPLDPIGRAFRFSSHAVAARPSSIRRMPTAPTRRRPRRRANCSRKSRACSPREEPEVDGEDRGERRKGLPKCDKYPCLFFSTSARKVQIRKILNIRRRIAAHMPMLEKYKELSEEFGGAEALVTLIDMDLPGGAGDKGDELEASVTKLTALINELGEFVQDHDANGGYQEGLVDLSREKVSEIVDWMEGLSSRME